MSMSCHVTVPKLPNLFGLMCSAMLQSMSAKQQVNEQRTHESFVQQQQATLCSCVSAGDA